VQEFFFCCHYTSILSSGAKNGEHPFCEKAYNGTVQKDCRNMVEIVKIKGGDAAKGRTEATHHRINIKGENGNESRFISSCVGTRTRR
jgi:hypothetical protein